MPEIPIIGQTTSRPKHDAPLHTDLTAEQKAALAKMAEDNPPTDEEIDERQPVTTAYVVVISEDGAVIATHDLTILDTVRPERQATPDDMYGASAVVQKDIMAMETANRTQQSMMQIGAAMQAQAQEAAIRRNLKLG